jgi:hypothetical protein
MSGGRKRGFVSFHCLADRHQFDIHPSLAKGSTAKVSPSKSLRVVLSMTRAQRLQTYKIRLSGSYTSELELHQHTLVTPVAFPSSINIAGQVIHHAIIVHATFFPPFRFCGSSMGRMEMETP